MAKKVKNNFKPISKIIEEYMGEWLLDVEFDKDGGKRIIYYKEK